MGSFGVALPFVLTDTPLYLSLYEITKPLFRPAFPLIDSFTAFWASHGRLGRIDIRGIGILKIHLDAALRTEWRWGAWFPIFPRPLPANTINHRLSKCFLVRLLLLYFRSVLFFLPP